MSHWVSTKFASWAQLANGQSMGLKEFLHVEADGKWLVHVFLGLHEVLLMDAVALLLPLLPQYLLCLHLLHHRAAHPEAHLKQNN